MESSEKLPVSDILKEIALMETSLAKVQVESGIEVPTKVVILTDSGLSMMRSDQNEIDEIVEHVNRTLGKGVGNALVTVSMGNALPIEMPDDMGSVDDALGLAFNDPQELLELASGGGHKVVMATVQYKWCKNEYECDDVTITMISRVIKNRRGTGETLGPTEAYVSTGIDGELVPCHGLHFDTEKLAPWKEGD